MSRYGRYGQSDTPWVQDGDPAFKGVNMLLDRALLPMGYLARSENKRLRDGVAATRPGTDFPGDFNPPFEDYIIGAHIYSNPNGTEVMLIATADATYVWACSYNQDPIQIPINDPDTPTTGTFLVNFNQAFDKVEMLRIIAPGTCARLVWDGDPTTKFEVVTLSTDGLTLVPNTGDAIPFQNRVLSFAPYNRLALWRDKIIMSDVLDYTSYDDILGTFYINAGEADALTSVLPYYKGSIVVFLENSVHMLENFTIDPTLAVQRLLNDRIGSVGYKMPVPVGADVIFLSRSGGFYKLSEIIQEQITSPPVPVSRPIQPVIDNIDWNRAPLYSCSAQNADYSYFAIPTLGKTGACDSVLVYNNVTGEWESAPDWWDDDSFRINRMLTTLYDGTPRVFGLDYAASRVYLLYGDGIEDQINGQFLQVNDTIETRGYLCGNPSGFKRFERAVIGIRSYDPNGVVTALSDGYNEEKQIATITKNRLRYYIHGKPDFNPLTDDPTQPKREDYSIGSNENFAIEDFESLPIGDCDFLPGTGGVFTGNKQQSLERFQIRQNGRYCSIRIENTSGLLDILGVGVESIPAQEAIKAVA